MTPDDQATQARVVQAGIDHVGGVRPLAARMAAVRGDAIIDGSRILHWLKCERRLTENSAILLEVATDGASRAADLYPFLAGIQLQPMSPGARTRYERQTARRKAKGKAKALKERAA